MYNKSEFGSKDSIMKQENLILSVSRESSVQERWICYHEHYYFRVSLTFVKNHKKAVPFHNDFQIYECKITASYNKENLYIALPKTNSAIIYS